MEAPTEPLPLALTRDQAEAFGREMDAIRERVMADLGERDARYIRRVVRAQRRAAIAGRALLFAGAFPPAWIAGTALLSLAKILDNMEIGHNVMHGQYDFMRDPALDSRRFEWDTACPASQWRHSHNVMHHTFTNIEGKDRDLGYGVLRMTEREPWAPRHLAQPLHALLLAVFFQWGVAFHDLELERVRAGDKPARQALAEAAVVWRKARKQVLKDYLLFPLLAGPFFLPVLLGNATANLARNLWAFAVIFCGHFPDGMRTFTAAETANETRGQWYVRQLLGSANIEGGKRMHLMSGNLSHQIEHHLFPELPAHRYAEIAVEVRAACARHGLPYNSRGFAAQLGSVARRIVRLALPPRARPSSPVTAS
jgi:fatty acid desaturase